MLTKLFVIPDQLKESFLANMAKVHVFANLFLALAFTKRKAAKQVRRLCLVNYNVICYIMICNYEKSNVYGYYKDIFLIGCKKVPIILSWNAMLIMMYRNHSKRLDTNWT